MTKQDGLANIIAGELNKQFKHQQVAYFLGEQEKPTDINGIVRELWNIKNKLNQIDGLYIRLNQMDKEIKEIQTKQNKEVLNG